MSDLEIQKNKAGSLRNRLFVWPKTQAPMWLKRKKSTRSLLLEGLPSRQGSSACSAPLQNQVKGADPLLPMVFGSPFWISLPNSPPLCLLMWGRSARLPDLRTSKKCVLLEQSPPTRSGDLGGKGSFGRNTGVPPCCLLPVRQGPRPTPVQPWAVLKRPM